VASAKETPMSWLEARPENRSFAKRRSSAKADRGGAAIDDGARAAARPVRKTGGHAKSSSPSDRLRHERIGRRIPREISRDHRAPRNDAVRLPAAAAFEEVERREAIFLAWTPAFGAWTSSKRKNANGTTFSIYWR